MPTLARITMLLLLLTLPACSVSQPVSGVAFPEHRPEHFTLGLVVFGNLGEDTSPAWRSARYIIEPGGVFRASFGTGSTPMTYPPRMRRLGDDQLQHIWEQVRSLGLGEEPWRTVQAPEQQGDKQGSERGYLLELRSGTRFDAWVTPIETGSAQELAEHLAALSWVTD